jgi:hypothetical protein
VWVTEHQLGRFSQRRAPKRPTPSATGGGERLVALEFPGLDQGKIDVLLGNKGKVIVGLKKTLREDYHADHRATLSINKPEGTLTLRARAVNVEAAAAMVAKVVGLDRAMAVKLPPPRQGRRKTGERAG